MGALILIAAGGAAGMMVAKQYARRPAEIKSIISSIKMLETEILYAATPLVEALERVASVSDKSVAKLFSSAYQELNRKNDSTAEEAWEKSLNDFYPESALSLSDLSILRNLGKALGKSDRSDQEKHIRLAYEQLRRELDKAEEDAAKNTKMWNYLGFCGAMAAVIIIY